MISEKKPFNNLIIIITVYERQQNIKRITEYYKDIETKKLLIDSSSDVYSHVDELEEAGFEYIFKPDEILYRAVYDVLKQHDEPYVVHVNDDDFVIKRSLYSCLEFLKQNSDYVFCQGQNIKFSEEGELLYIPYGIEEYLNLVQLEMEGTNCEDRLEMMFRYFHTPNHAVFRMSVLRECFETVIEHDFLMPIHFWDKIIGAISAIRGKFKMLPVLYQLRSKASLLRSDLSYPPKLEIETEFGEIMNRIQKNSNPFAEKLSNQMGYDRKRAEEVVESVFTKYWNEWRRDSILDKFKNIMNICKRKLGTVAPNTLRLPSEDRRYSEDIQEILNLVKHT